MRPARRSSPRPKKRVPPKKRKKAEWCEASGRAIPREDEVPVDIERAGDRGQYHGPVTARGKFRCPKCNRRLVPRMMYCIGREYTGQRIPQHKAK